jgi:hypothetical protein
MIDISRYDRAFALVTDNLPRVVKVALVAVALNCNYGEALHAADVQRLFAQYNQADVLRALDEVVSIETRQSRGSMTPDLARSPVFPGPNKVEAAALAEMNKRLDYALSDVERRFRPPEA